MERTPTPDELPPMDLLVRTFKSLDLAQTKEVSDRYGNSRKCGLHPTLAMYKALRAYGHIESCLTQRSDQGAAEYDEAMAAQDMIDANRR